MTVFATRGFAAATLEEVARRAGFSHQTVRDRFGNKARLWQAVQRDGWDRLLAAVARRVARSNDPRARLEGALDALVQLGTDTPHRVLLLMRCDQAAPPTDEIGDLRLWLVTLLTDAGASRPQIFAAMLLGGLCGLCGRHQTNGTNVSDLFREVALQALGS